MSRRETLTPIEERIWATSQRYYRSGLSKAGAGDLSRAVDDLEKAVRYDKRNELARNLLGLIQFQRGELGEAMKQWSISEYLNPLANWASYYLKEIKREQSLLTDMSDSIRLYNEAGELARKGSLDFAVTRLRKAVHLNPRFVRAQLLLALCYMETQRYKTALTVLDQVAKVDPLNPEAMRYRLIISRQRKDGVKDAALDDIRDLSRDLYVQQALPEPDKEEIFQDRRSRKKAVRNISAAMMQLLLFFAGALCCLGFMLTLWFPGQIRDLKSEVQELTITQEKLRGDKDELQKKIDAAGQALLAVSKDGASVPAATLADIQKLVDDWGLEDES